MTQEAQTEGRPLAWLWAVGEDRPWLALTALLTALQAGWWAIAWAAGAAPAPYLPVYLALAFGGLAAAFALRSVLRPRAPRAPWPGVILGMALIAAGASVFLPLKYAIPSTVPFWLDAPLAAAERGLFGDDPWRLLDQALGWAIGPMDWLYGLWLPTQVAVLLAVLLEPPSAARSRALMAYSLAWFLLGVVGATLLASAGPIFYDRLFGGGAFAGLHEMLRARGAWIVLAESEGMWRSLASGDPDFVAGISAAPSMHVAVSAWIALTAWRMAPRLAPAAWAYVAAMWIGSVQLGWHYVADGALGVLGAAACWALAGVLERRSRRGA